MARSKTTSKGSKATRTTRAKPAKKKSASAASSSRKSSATAKAGKAKKKSATKAKAAAPKGKRAAAGRAPAKASSAQGAKSTKAAKSAKPAKKPARKPKKATVRAKAAAVPSDSGTPSERGSVPGIDEPAASAPTSKALVKPAADSGTALSRRDPFQAYLREVQRYPLLTADEEAELTQAYYKTGDPNIAARLVTANLRLVIKLAYEYRRAYRNIMDLIQEGNIGLMQAVKRYDPYRGVKLSSYAAWWIRAYMLRFILNNWRLVKLGTTQAQRKLFFNLNKQKAKLSAMGIEPSAKEIANRLGVQEREVIEMDRRMSSAEASLDAPLGDSEGRTVSRSDLLPSADQGADETVAQQQMSELLGKHLKTFRETLSGKDMIIFDRRMIAEDPLTLQKLGDEFGVSRERVRQLEARLAGRLREYLKEHMGDAVELGG
ncbi:MAG: RNA polymerase factor sigma-32 [Deltaproteobacteria bacterium]|jgi:RNA polymerase sigma-32 factor|nr:RNA polymerase factor sigma-32 [Deltaproteobacteria bacterium]MBW2537823.1 RNA polymerase factor sigma-32 [Deltaproteobacteria bacterium]